MNPTLMPIFSRRSIRKYTGEPVDEGAINDLLEAGMSAPSACAKDPWRFIVLRSTRLRRKIAAGLPNGKMLADAALGLAVCGDMRVAHGGELSYLIQDCSAAIQNILLAASMLGFGACWLGVHPREDRVTLLRELLKLPEPVLPVAVIAIGRPAEVLPARTRLISGYIHSETWESP
ncbi:MAG: NADH dehydrogenase [Lentisphaerae bacterium RIFOXYC12_FULL_60_16]|nr:MAG: NADH dehydrogenase [Lentisphaerae bacterium RIFOXYC12_FULL_60_16]OGV76276.1 MAG: NADH dehydrogenase [Lentisphaerae bacterium RIFOXYB12_FULL_60_10]